MSDRRASDPAFVRLEASVSNLQDDFSNLASVPKMVADIDTKLQVLNSKITISALIFGILFPVICTWNYFLGNEVKELGERVAENAVYIKILTEAQKQESKPTTP